MGTPRFAVPTLAALAARTDEVVAVYTQPARSAGRGMAARQSPVEVAAAARGLPVRTPASLKPPEEAAALAALRPDVVLVVAYGQILPGAVLAAPRHGCLNLHASLLPRWRGAAPIERAIMAGDAETGVMVMQMEAGLDTGPVALGTRTRIGDDETAGDLGERLARDGAALAMRALDALVAGTLAFAPQSAGGVTYARKIDKSETRIDWTHPAAEVHNHIRGLSPDPGAWFEADFGKGRERIRALRSTRADGAGAPGTVLDDALAVACGDGAVRLLELQRAGRQPLQAEAFLRGTAIVAGSRLG
jgi:methionyl-tRNA formyltransferase